MLLTIYVYRRRENTTLVAYRNIRSAFSTIEFTSVAFLYEATCCTQASVFPGQISVALILSTNNAPVSCGSFDDTHTHTYAYARTRARVARERRSKYGKYANIKENSIVIIMKNEI